MGLKAASRQPANMSKVYAKRHGPEENPVAFLECLQKSFRRYTLYDPELALIFAFMNQAISDRKNLQKLYRLEEKGI